MPRHSEPGDDEFFDERPSKSERKREMTALQDLGAAIVKLKDGELATIPLEGELQEAIAMARRLKSGEGLRRQMQYIGKLMRRTDIGAVRAAYEDLLSAHSSRNQRFHALEQLRDEVITSGVPAMDKVLEQYPDADRQHLRQLITAAVKEREQEKPPAAARKLFRYLRELAAL